MSLENSFERIAEALEAIASGNGFTVGARPPIAQVTPGPAEEKPAPGPEKKAEPTNPFEQAVKTLCPTDAAATHTEEFTDNAGLVAYAMRSYTEVGAEKGAKIQGALTTLGYSNINDVKPEDFQGFFDAVEAIKREG
jgi:hypothetical protein